ncbi:unnamed protein product, partial [Brassica rapa]
MDKESHFCIIISSDLSHTRLNRTVAQLANRCFISQTRRPRTVQRNKTLEQAQRRGSRANGRWPSQ